jgi:hypothetical protein
VHWSTPSNPKLPLPVTAGIDRYIYIQSRNLFGVERADPHDLLECARAVACPYTRAGAISLLDELPDGSGKSIRVHPVYTFSVILCFL